MASSFVRSLSPLGAGLLASLISVSVPAASLGPMQVHSRLGQSFLAEIEVTGEKSELDSLRVLAAPAADYYANGLDYDSSIRSLKIELERRGETRMRVRLRTDSGVGLPIGNLLLDARWEGGALRRDYVFLLDPPEEISRIAPSPTNQPATPIANAAVTPMAESTPAAKPVADAPNVAPAILSGEYRTQAGDTLERVARKAQTGSASKIQTMAAIYQANPAAFVGGNANQLRRNVTLKLPDEAAATALGAAAARKVIVQASGGSFESHRKAIAEASAAMPASEGEATRSAAGRIAPVVEDPAPTRASGGRLHIGQGEGKVSKGTRRRIEALEEEIATKGKSLEEQNARIQELQTTMEQLNALLAMQQEASAPAAAAEASAPIAEQTASAPEENLVMPALPRTETSEAPMAAEAVVIKNAREPESWYEDTAIQTLLLILAAGGGGWVAFRRYRDRKWREADRQLQRERGMPVDESVLSLA